MRYGAPARVKTVMTVHNLAFQGQFGCGHLRRARPAGRAPWRSTASNITAASASSRPACRRPTRSPRSARPMPQEIRTPEFGMGLDGLLSCAPTTLDRHRQRHRHRRLGSRRPTRRWPQTYSAKTLEAARGQQARRVEERFGLDDDDGPLFCVVSRLTWQKGMDMLAAVVDGLVAAGAQAGRARLGRCRLSKARCWPPRRAIRGRVGVVIGYDEALSHLMQGGADAIADPVALRALRADPALRPALWLRAGGEPRRRAGRHGDRRQRGGGRGRRRDRHPVRAGRRRMRCCEAIQRDDRALCATDKVWRKMQRRGMKSDVSWDAQRRALCRALSHRCWD